MEHITDNVWGVVATVNVRGVLRMEHRMTVVRAPDGSLLHSPVELNEPLARDVEALGPVRHIFAPNLKHDLYLGTWLERFPEADFLVVPGFSDVRPDLPTGREISVDALPSELGVYPIEGMPALNEHVLLHRPSRTLIVADLIFNLHRADDLWSRALMWLNGSWRRAAPSRFLRTLIDDREALRASVDRVLELDFDRLVVGHGDIVETGGREVLRSAYAWLD